jgi:hypothetical protein
LIPTEAVFQVGIGRSTLLDGDEKAERIAVPMLGGMVSSTILTLVVIPAIYGLMKGWRLPAPNAQNISAILEILVTIARSLSDTFAGIAPGGVSAFVIAQLLGMLAAVGLTGCPWTNGEVRLGSKAAVGACPLMVRSCSMSRHQSARPAGPFSAKGLNRSRGRSLWQAPELNMVARRGVLCEQGSRTSLKRGAPR